MSSAPLNPPSGDRPPAKPATKVPRWFHVMVKPAGSGCNLDCKYCYYLHKDKLLSLPEFKRITPEALETFIRSYIEATHQSEIVFTWQGGEPTLLGLDFYHQVVELQRKHTPPGKHIANDLQTNGLLLDDEWCAFLRRNNFLVGLSIDGPKHLHDEFRVTRGGQPTFDRVMAAVKRLKAHKIKFNTLTVIHRLNVKYPLDIYRFLTRELDSPTIQFIPCVEPKSFERVAPGHWDAASMPVVGSPAARPGSPDSVVTDWSVDPDDFGEFLCKCFDEWHSRDLGKRMVAWFENSVGLWMGLPSQMCVFSDICGKGVALERDGGLYSCDHFVYPEYRLGNIQDTPMADLVFSERQLQFGRNKSDSLPRYCRECEYLFACHGECPKNRFVRTPDGEPGLNYLCPGLKRFFAHADERLRDIAARCAARTP
jgi:uncharacterized protein